MSRLMLVKIAPYYTGKQRTASTEGSVARFTQRFGRCGVKEVHDAGIKLTAQCKTASSGLPDSQTQGASVRYLQI
jgi:hypothetical protein